MMTERKELKLVRKKGNTVLEEKWKNGVLYFAFPQLSKLTFCVHGFSSRIGGVSEGEFAQMNLSFTRGDKEECVR